VLQHALPSRARFSWTDTIGGWQTRHDGHGVGWYGCYTFRKRPSAHDSFLILQRTRRDVRLVVGRDLLQRLHRVNRAETCAFSMAEADGRRSDTRSSCGIIDSHFGAMESGNDGKSRISGWEARSHDLRCALPVRQMYVLLGGRWGTQSVWTICRMETGPRFRRCGDWRRRQHWRGVPGLRQRICVEELALRLRASYRRQRRRRRRGRGQRCIVSAVGVEEDGALLRLRWRRRFWRGASVIGMEEHGRGRSAARSTRV
jgi:hypothetical protein